MTTARNAVYEAAARFNRKVKLLGGLNDGWQPGENAPSAAAWNAYWTFIEPIAYDGGLRIETDQYAITFTPEGDTELQWLDDDA